MGGAVVGDLWAPDERGSAMSVYSLAPLVSTDVILQPSVHELTLYVGRASYRTISGRLDRGEEPMAMGLLECQYRRCIAPGRRFCRSSSSYLPVILLNGTCILVPGLHP